VTDPMASAKALLAAAAFPPSTAAATASAAVLTCPAPHNTAIAEPLA